MELRVLKYFLAVAREQSISKAAEALFVTQPNLSRQMQNLEKEIGQQLFIRGTRKITLTEAGQLLRKRAEEIIELYNKTENELNAPITDISGDIYIGGGESYVMGIIAKAAHRVQEQYPNVRFHLFSGDMVAVGEKLDKGLIDFGIFIEPADLSKYEYMRLPLVDTWGVLMKKDSPLADKEFITPEDLWDKPLIRSKHSLGKGIISDWFRKPSEELNIVATYNLLYNASILVEQGIGYAVSLDRLINTSGNSFLCFRPLFPELISHLDIAWKKYQVFPKCAEIFLKRLQEII
ncbi:LysR family transcriptional regulator [Pumilibacter intestinalis]|uniref:LysR family transcriptional regulator n=1 Tax=Pumilibacter intestinalis TaxID=2941511 RepID=UPI00203A4C34|nr:LysR family transcriptional regulator [Pumilibacter intestinalis]